MLRSDPFVLLVDGFMIEMRVIGVCEVLKGDLDAGREGNLYNLFDRSQSRQDS